MYSKLSRTPSNAVIRQLRSEVSFGCPVKNCGSPYLTWHHFNPPWHIEPHHNPDGMIALCLQHHKEADTGAFTDEQLKKLKKYPYLKTAKKLPSGYFSWKRENLLLVAGDNFYYKSWGILKVYNKPLIWLSKDENDFDLLNLDIRDRNGNCLVAMKDNTWIINDSPDDLVCPPNGNSLKLNLKKHKISLDLKFSRLHVKSNKKIIEKIASENPAFYQKVINNKDAVICNIGGNLVWPVNIQITHSKLVVDTGTITSNYQYECNGFAMSFSPPL